MNDASDISTAAERVRRTIRDDARSGAAALVDFAQANAATGRLKHEALLLKMRQQQLPGRSTGDTEALMLDLLGRIEDDHRKSWNPAVIEARKAALSKLQARLLEQPSTTRPVWVGKGVGKSYPGTDFHLRGVDLEIRPGEVTAVVGQNANGKTTLLRIVAGELRSSEGSVTFPMLSSGPKLDWPAIKSQIAYLPQDLPVLHGSLRDNLHYEAALHGILGDENQGEVDFFVERFGLEEHLDKRWSQLSGGYKLRFSLARVLVCKPKLLVLDEPLANLDVVAQSRLLQDLLDVARSPRYPLAILMSSQHLHELEAVASTIVFLRNGEVVFNGPMNEVGRERAYNIYELGTSADISAIKQLFDDPRHDEPVHNGVSVVIKTATEVDAAAALQRLLAAGIDIKYFRDVSRSIKSFFE